jgi:hypothetical protein
MVTTREQVTQNAQQIIRDVFNLGANSSLEKHLPKMEPRSILAKDHQTGFVISRCTCFMNVLRDLLRPMMVET